VAGISARRQSTLILNGGLAISHSANVGPKEADAIDVQIRKSMPRWRKAADSASLPHVAPEAGAFFWTGNRSLVLVLAIDSDGDGRVLVVEGGHGDSCARGDHPGSCYLVNASGHFRSDSPISSLFGMDLQEKAAVEFAAPNPLALTSDGTFTWLWHMAEHTPRTLPSNPRGFFRTLNNSLVFVTGDGAKPSLCATVCSGGHAVKELNGTKPNERYALTSSGQFLVSAEKAKALPAASLALASGMSLAASLPLILESLGQPKKTVPRTLHLRKKELPANSVTSELRELFARAAPGAESESPVSESSECSKSDVACDAEEEQKSHAS
jgi:hypothetical protein